MSEDLYVINTDEDSMSPIDAVLYRSTGVVKIITGMVIIPTKDDEQVIGYYKFRPDGTTEFKSK